MSSKNPAFAIFCALLLALVLLAGCVKIEMNLNVNPDGKGSSEMIMDLSGLAALSASATSGASGAPTTAEMNDTYSKAKICDTLLKNQTDSAASSNPFSKVFALEKAKCEPLADYKARLYLDDVDFIATGLLKTSEGLMGKSYTLSIPANADASASSNDAQLTMIKNAGASIMFNVSMPGQISSSSVGTISADKKKVSIDLLSDMSKFNQGVTVVSEETSLLPIIAGIVVLLLIVAGVVFFVVLKKKPTPAPVPVSPPSP